MGYVRNKLVKLTFADPEFEGLEIIAKSLSMGEALELQKLAPKDTTNPTPEEIKAAFIPFVSHVVSWNLEDDNGKELPKTLDALLSLDIEFVNTVVMAYMTEVMGVDPKQQMTSQSGLSMESLPMETL